MDKHVLYSYQSKPSYSQASSTASNHTVASLPRITHHELSNHVLAEHPSLAIIDVRDSDFIGGHIRGCKNVPAPTLDWKMPELVRELKQKEVVVFHCALSQQRGPSAALKYLRERNRLFPGLGRKTDESGETGESAEKEVKKEQKVYVLDGGFVRWQEKFGEDKRLTEGYVKDIWEYGY
jgi:rhodanese-related sulfurtransferase